ncbi:MAG: DUF285 domain-containing protein [Bacteroidales bacterium]|nr:DUF285 domain-containing protein [Bacteroidales bacterium]
MKRIMMMAIAAMALLAVSCQKDEKMDKLPTFTAHADNGGMKTDLVGNLIYWNSADQVKVFGNQGYAIYGVTPRTDDPTWATLTALEDFGLNGSGSYRFIYPAEMAESDATNNNLYITYPVTRNINDTPLKYYPMYAESAESNVMFNNVGGLVKIILPEITQNVNHIIVSSDEPISGRYRLNNDLSLDFDGTATYEDKRVMVSTGGNTFSAGDCVYVAVPAGQYHNFTIEIIAGAEHATKVGSLVDVQASAITTITLSNLNFVDYEWPAATLMERAFFTQSAESITRNVEIITFHYNYYDDMIWTDRIDDNANFTPIYYVINGTNCDVYTPAAEIYAPTDCRDLFGNIPYPGAVDFPLNQINFGNGFNTSNVTNMSLMFRSCIRLTSIDLSSFNTSNVTNMHGMFGSCRALTNLDLSSLNTSNVTDMGSMFDNCSSLTSLDLSSFNTGNVTNMRSMFSGCSSLTSLDLSTFNTGNVTDMELMFYSCSSLTSLNVSSFNTANVLDMSHMFSSCTSLTNLNLSSFNTANVLDMSQMFSSCTSLTNLNLSSFNTSNDTNMSYMFKDCSNLTNLNITSFNTENVVHMSEMFRRCISLTSLNLTSFSGNSLTDFSEVFSGCTSLGSILFSNSFTLNNSCYVWNALEEVGSASTTTIKCNIQTKNQLINAYPNASPGSGVVWDLY